MKESDKIKIVEDLMLDLPAHESIGIRCGILLVYSGVKPSYEIVLRATSDVPEVSVEKIAKMTEFDEDFTFYLNKNRWPASINDELEVDLILQK